MVNSWEYLEVLNPAHVNYAENLGFAHGVVSHNFNYTMDGKIVN